MDHASGSDIRAIKLAVWIMLWLQVVSIIVGPFAAAGAMSMLDKVFGRYNADLQKLANEAEAELKKIPEIFPPDRIP